MNLRLEPRTDAPRWFSGVMTLAALVVALLVSAFIIWLVVITMRDRRRERSGRG